MAQTETTDMNARKTFPLAALAVALGFGVSSQAHAYAYANGYLEIGNGTITVLPANWNTPGDLTGFGTCLAGDGINPCATLLNQSPSTSANAALVGGTGTTTNGATDAAVAVGTGSVFPGGSTPTNNAFSSEGASATDSYAWGDAQIVSQQAINLINPTNPDGSPNFTSYIETKQQGEANSTDATLGTSGGTTSSSSDATVYDLTVGTVGTQIAFQFDSTENLAASIVSPSTGVLATTTATTTLSITNADGSITYFEWKAGSTPTGSAGFFIGYSGLTNGYTGTQLSTTTPDTLTLNQSGTFSVLTGNLGVGNYKLAVRSEVVTSVQATTVPEPASLALLGIGILGAAGSRRIAARKRSA
jgi:hypothetical protein